MGSRLSEEAVSASSENWHAKLRVTVEDYHRLGEVGALVLGPRVELIDGEIVNMPPAGRRYAAVVERLVPAVFAAVADRAIVRIHRPLRLGDRSEPQPDLALLNAREGNPHATNTDALLIIEISESTRRYVRTVKVPLYARHSVGEVWVVDLANELVHFYRRPAGDSYADVVATDRPGVTPIAALPGVSADLTGILG
jgi:Uma2 family endonuclease